MQTRIFGRLRGTVRLPMVEQEDGAAASTGARSSCSPACAQGEKLTRETTLAERGDILARDGTPLAKGPDRLSDLGPLAAEVAGRVGPAPPERAAELARRGVPDGAPVGLNGLEREFDERLAGSPGGILRAGTRVVARAKARDGDDVRSPIDPDIQRAAVEALAGRFGGIAVLRPVDGRGAGALGHRVLRAPAAGLDVQDHHARRGARGAQGQAERELPRPDADRSSRASRSRTPTARRAAAR